MTRAMPITEYGAANIYERFAALEFCDFHPDMVAHERHLLGLTEAEAHAILTQIGAPHADRT